MSISRICENQPDSAPVVVTRQFDDIDVCAQAIKQLNITGTQLTSGQFAGRVSFADLGSLKFTDATYNQGIRIKGLKNPHLLGFTIALQGEQTQVLAHGCPIKKHDLFGFDPTKENDVITGKDAHIVLANVDLFFFQSLAEQMGYHDLGQKFFQQNLLHFDLASFRHLRAYYQQVSQILIHKPSLFESQAQSYIIENFLPLLMDTIGASIRQKRPIIKTLRRYPIVKKAEEISQSYINKPLTLKQLCDALETSSSALYYGFQDIFGMSPMAIYIKIQRLNGVRRALKKADPSAIMVMKLAHEWGFWSPGHFARDYRQMFGELPSETLRR